MYVGKSIKKERKLIVAALLSFAATLVGLLLAIQLGVTVTGLPEWAWAFIAGATVSWIISSGTRLYGRYCYKKVLMETEMRSRVIPIRRPLLRHKKEGP